MCKISMNMLHGNWETEADCGRSSDEDGSGKDATKTKQ